MVASKKRFLGTWMLLGGTALGSLTPMAALAQDIELDTLVISGNLSDDDLKSIVALTSTASGKLTAPILDTPASVSVITAKEMARRDVKTTEEVLSYTAGVVADFYGSDNRYDYFKIRGLDATTYRDGLTVGRPFLGLREEPYAFERIEVLKGANSSAFGVGDPGGSVNYVTKTPKSQRFGEAYLSGGTYNRKEVGFDLGDNIGQDDTFSYRLTGKLRLAEDEYADSQDDEGFFMGGLTWRPTEATSLTVVYDHLSKSYTPNSGGYPAVAGLEFDRGDFFGEPDFNYANVERNTLSVMADHDFGSGLKFAANARYSNAESDYGYVYLANPPAAGSTLVPRDYVANESTRENFVIDANLQYDTTIGGVGSRTLAGLGHYRDYASSTGWYDNYTAIDYANPIYSGAPVLGAPYVGSDNKLDTFINSIYVQQELTFAEQFIVTLGARNDWMDLEKTDKQTGAITEADYSEFTKRAALIYKITPEVSTYVSYAESAMPASPYGTADLSMDPERGHQWEVGVKYQPSAFPGLFSAAVYDLTKSNITRTDTVTKQLATIGKVRVQGIDLEAKAEIMENLSLTAGYAYMVSKIVENGDAGYEGNELAMVPNHTASLWVDYTVPSNGTIGDMTFGLGARYTGEYFINQDNEIKADSAIIFDAAFTYDIQENTNLQLNVSNIFDEQHAVTTSSGGFGTTYYNPGRTATLTLKQTW